MPTIGSLRLRANYPKVAGEGDLEEGDDESDVSYVNSKLLLVVYGANAWDDVCMRLFLKLTAESHCYLLPKYICCLFNDEYYTMIISFMFLCQAALVYVRQMTVNSPGYRK